MHTLVVVGVVVAVGTVCFGVFALVYCYERLAKVPDGENILENLKLPV